MEKERHDDNLDRFLQKALGQFDATPGPGLWDRIESDLGPAGKAPRRGLYVQRGHLAVAAAVVLLLFAWQYCHFSQELEAIQTEIRNTAYQPPSLPEGTATEPAIATTSSSNEVAIMESPEPAKMLTSSGNVTSGEDVAAPFSVVPGKFAAAPTPVEKSGQATPVPAIVLENESGVAGADTVVHRVVNALDFVPGIKSSLVHRTVMPIPFVVNSVITSIHHEKAGFSVGGQTTRAVVVPKSAEQEPGYGPPPGEKYFPKADAENGEVWSAGVVLEKAVNKKWSIVSGADYLVHTVERIQRPKLKFSDRDPHWGGHNDEHKFNYYVNTGSSTYALDVDLREIDPSVVIDPDEELEFSLTTVQRSTAVSIPLAAQYRLQKGRWSVLLRAGLRLNAWLKNEGELSSFTCSNPLFEIRNKPDFRPDERSAVSLTSDAMFAVGAAYKVGRFGFQLTPVLNTPMLKGIQNNTPAASGLWTGVSAGAQYYF